MMGHLETLGTANRIEEKTTNYITTEIEDRYRQLYARINE